MKLPLGKIITLKTINRILKRFNRLMTICEKEYVEKLGDKSSPELTFYKDAKSHSQQAIDALELLFQEIEDEKKKEKAKLAKV